MHVRFLGFLDAKMLAALLGNKAFNCKLFSAAERWTPCASSVAALFKIRHS